jgi:hypothetical protein
MVGEVIRSRIHQVKERASFGSDGLYGEVATGNSGVGTL